MIPIRIILHHSLTRDSQTVSWGAIRDYHKKKGWRDIGYHAGIEWARNKAETFMGRMWDKQGAHTFRHNGNSLGLCIVGNFDEEIPDPMIWGAALKLVRFWMRLYKIPVSEVYGHHDFVAWKSCPGLMFDMEKFKRDLNV